MCACGVKEIVIIMSDRYRHYPNFGHGCSLFDASYVGNLPIHGVATHGVAVQLYPNQVRGSKWMHGVALH